MALSCALIKGPLYYSAARNTFWKDPVLSKEILGLNPALKATPGSPARVWRLDTPLLSQFCFSKMKAWDYFKMFQIWLRRKFWKSNFKQMGALVDRQPRELLPTGWGCRRQDREHSGRMAADLLHLLLFPSAARPTYGNKPPLGTDEFSSPARHSSSGYAAFPKPAAECQIVPMHISTPLAAAWKSSLSPSTAKGCQCWKAACAQGAARDPRWSTGRASGQKQPLAGWESCLPGLPMG